MAGFARLTCIDCDGPKPPGRDAKRQRCDKCDKVWEIARARATNAVHRAVKRGQMPKPSALTCVDCGDPACDYDHRDYSKPLDVAPVCRSCNQLRGPATPLKAEPDCDKFRAPAIKAA